MGKRRHWTPAEIAIVKRDYPTAEIEELAKRLKRSVCAVYLRADQGKGKP
jgi:hypothetical protein